MGGFDEDLPALVDWDLVIRLAERGPIDFEPTVLVEQRFSDNSITRSGEKRLIAQAHILAKHGDLIARHGLIAYHHHRLAGGYRRIAQLPEARQHAWQAIRAAPLSPRHWAGLLATLRG